MIRAIVVLSAGCMLLAAGCGSGAVDEDEPTEPATTHTRAATSTPRPAASAATTVPATAEVPAPGAPTVAPAGGAAPSGGAMTGSAPPAAPAAPQAPPPPPPPPAPATSGITYNASQGTAQVNGASLTPADLSGAWVKQTDVVLAAAPPEADGCGWLASRTVANLPQDAVANFLNKQTLGFFTNATSYATEAGAIDCAARAAERFSVPGALARAFMIFVNPDAVVVAPFTYPQVGDGSIAGTLTGKVDANGTLIDITLLVVAYRKGNVSGVIGSARSGQTPPPDELAPLINLVISRITANQ